MFRRVKGAEDFFPAEKAVQNEVFGRLKKSAGSFGFSEVETPAMESLKLLAAKSGEEVKSQIFTLEKRGEEELGLRFDLTVPITRMFISRQRALPKPVKWFGLSRMWRYESPQKGRLREFYQLSIELFGSERPVADAEIINCLISCLESVGLSARDVIIRINNRELMEGILTDLVGDKIEAVSRVIDKSGKITAADFDAELKKAGAGSEAIVILKKIVKLAGDPEEISKELQSIVTLSEKSKAGLQNVLAVLDLVPADWTELSLSTVRGLAYYTGTVFECFDREGKLRSIAGGGRYDALVELLGGAACPATGFGLGYATLLELLKEKNLLPKLRVGPQYYVAPVDEDVYSDAQEIAKSLRKKFSVVIDLMGRKLSKQFDYANSIGAQKVVIVGRKDLEKGQVTVRDLISGNEKQVPVKILNKSYIRTL